MTAQTNHIKPASDSARGTLATAAPTNSGVPITAAQWDQLLADTRAVSNGDGRSFKQFIDKLYAEALKDQESREMYGDTESDSDGSDSDDNEDNEDTFDNTEDMEDGTESLESAQGLTQEQRWERASFPYKTLPPTVDTIGALNFDADRDSDTEDYMSLSSDVSDRQEEVDNCDCHSTFVECTCSEEGGQNACNKHMDGAQCTCGIDKERVDHSLMDIEGGEPAEEPQCREEYRALRYFTRSKAKKGEDEEEG